VPVSLTAVFVQAPALAYATQHLALKSKFESAIKVSPLVVFDLEFVAVLPAIVNLNLSYYDNASESAA